MGYATNNRIKKPVLLSQTAFRLSDPASDLLGGRDVLPNP